jgi:glucose-1-phosphate cytidylyltransferase
MKAVLLAGGLGTRISEETHLKPKPMVEIGGRPILWHIMKIYSAHGVNDFVICCGCKGYVIKEYFANYFLHMSDITFCMKKNKMQVHKKRVELWTVTLVDTGKNPLTSGRLKRVHDYLGNKDYCFTYGDGVANVDITAQVAFHKRHGKLVTVTAVQLPERYGALETNAQRVKCKVLPKNRVVMAATSMVDSSSCRPK